MSITEAQTAQKQLPKKILIDFFADWCGPCKLMDSKTYSNPIIAELINTQFYPVKFDAESVDHFNFYGRDFGNTDAGKMKHRNALHDFTKYMNISSVPSILFLDEKSQPITILNGFLSAKEIEPYLTIMAEDVYKKIKNREDWDDYQRKFRSNIKD